MRSGVRRRLLRSRFWSWLVLRALPKMRFSLQPPRLTGEQYHDGLRRLAVGDIVLSSDRRRATYWLIPGEVSHAALCVGLRSRGDAFEMVDMVSSGFRRSDFFDQCKADRVVIARCLDWDDAYVERVVLRALAMDGTSYDVGFDLDPASLYCSELVYHADFERRLRIPEGTRRVLPVDLLRAGNVRVVWDSETVLL